MTFKMISGAGLQNGSTFLVSFVRGKKKISCNKTFYFSYTTYYALTFFFRLNNKTFIILNNFNGI